jgi:hypothetical protein
VNSGLVVNSHLGDDLQLPYMHEIHQQFDVLPAVDPLAAISTQWPRADASLVGLPLGAQIALAVGSRGISDIVPVVRDVAVRLKRAGCEPFIVPAMGSHGGATAEGQTEVLRALGITEAAVGAPVRATMGVVSLGVADGIQLSLDRLAWEADGIVLINRVKPHTDFAGPVESGLLKMLVIGLGNQVGADHYHRLGVVRSLQDTIPIAGRALLARAKVLFGVALVENEDHRAAIVRVAPATEIEANDRSLLGIARQHLPDLPLDDIDLLIVDEMGKDISGSGMDPNVIGRTSAAWMSKHELPRITRILVRELSAKSEGNAIGLGMVDAITRRLAEQVDIQGTAVNAVTSCCPEDAKIPLTFESDRDALATLLRTIRPYDLHDLRLAYIRNTLSMARLWVSVGCLPHLRRERNIRIDERARELIFDAEGYLRSPFACAPGGDRTEGNAND